MGESSSVARTWLMLGDVSENLGDFRHARENYERALEICHANADLRCAAEAANNSGNDAERLGQFSEAFSRLQEAAKDWQELSLPQQAGQTFSNLGISFRHGADFDQAINMYDHARTLLRNREPLAYAKVLSNLGLCYIDLGQLEKAQVYFQNAIHAETGISGAENDLILSRMNFGRSLMLEGRLHEALPILEMTVAAASSRPNRQTRAYTLNNLGQLLWRLHHIDAAESRLNSALELYRGLGDKRGEAIALHYLGLIARERGDLSDARSLLGQALQLRRDYGMRDEAADSLYELAKLELAAGDATRAKSLVEDAIPLLETVRTHVPGATLRASFYARRRNLLELLVNIAMRPGNKDATIEGFIAAERGRGRALLDLLAERRLSVPQPAELADRQARIRRDINLLSQRKAMPPYLREIDKVYLWGSQVFGKDPSEFMPAVAGFGRHGDEDGWLHFLASAAKIFSRYGDIPFVHWAPYEKTNLSKYVQRYGDPNGIAARVLVNLLDLLTVAKNSIVLPLPSFSLKVVEKYVGFKRTLDEYGGDWAMATKAQRSILRLASAFDMRNHL